jgi:tRNA 2-thiouridine synthesizing protein E
MGGRDQVMDAIDAAGRSYPLDRRGFLADPGVWDLQFTAAMARRLGVPRELTLLQLKVVLFVRRRFVEQGEVARVHETCRGCGLSLARLRALFPWGFQRGVCRLAGIPYQVIDDGHHALTYETVARPAPGDDDSPAGPLPRASGHDGD